MMILSFDLRSQNKVLDQKLFKKESDIRGTSRTDHYLNFRQAGGTEQLSGLQKVHFTRQRIQS